MRYRRARTKGGTYFFTVTTFKPEKILTKPGNVKILCEAFRYIMEKHAVTIDAFVLLPDHLHCIWTLPQNNRDFSTRSRLVKSYFTQKCDKKFKQTPWESRKKKKEQAIWQRRFWEHLICDEKDWEYSSFQRYVRKGINICSDSGFRSTPHFRERAFLDTNCRQGIIIILL